jgi:hypothetical protein
MMITTTIKHLVDADMSGALNRLSALRLPVKPAYHVHRLIGLVKAELKTYDERRLDLVRQYGEERDATQTERQQGSPAKVHEVLPGTDAFDRFKADIDELKTIEVTLQWRAFDLKDLGNNEIMPADLALLGPLVHYEDDVK